MEVTVLGRFGPYPAPGGACSSYFVQAGSTKLVLDLGAGAFARLAEVAPELDINCIILSHLHSDHIGDMFILRYALRQYSERGKRATLPLPVIAPDEPREEYRMLAASGVFDMTVSSDAQTYRVGDVRITLARTTHAILSYAVTLEHEGKKLVYTGDTGPRHDLADICRDADLLIADTNYYDEECPAGAANHMGAGQAGKLAAECGAKRLLCTHIRGALCDTGKLMQQVRRYYPEAELAEEMRTYAL